MVMKLISAKNTDAALVTKTLAGRPFALRVSPTIPALTRFVQTSLSLILVPLALPLGLAWAALMSTPWRESLISMVIPRVMQRVEREFHRERQELLATVSGRVLDVGSGGGAYMRYLGRGPSDTTTSKTGGGNVREVVAVEPLEHLHPLIRSKAEEAGVQSLTVCREMDELFGDANEVTNPFDWVVLGNVLCEVPDVPSIVHQVSRLLKPGGKVYFQEHVGRRVGTWQRAVQDFVNPAWRHMSGGCNCNRDSVSILKSHSCWEDVVDWQYDHISVGLGPMVLGLAQKKASSTS